MELSRRDALAALSALGTSATAGCLADAPRDTPTDEMSSGSGQQRAVDTDALVDTYVAVAEVVYPSELSGLQAFVESFVPPRLDRENHGPAMAATVAEFDEIAQEWYGDRVVSLAPATREDVLEDVGVRTADEDPEGTLAERVRFYLVNELLLALYSSPTGGELVGIENPQGHPGGTDTYQRGPGR
jgi:hypothetical protein